MAEVYDGRRPRIPSGLAADIDGARGQVPFNRFIVQTLAGAVGHVLPEPEPKPAPRPAPKPKSKPRQKPVVDPPIAAQDEANAKAEAEVRRPRISPHKAKMFTSTGDALAKVQAKHRAARERNSQRRDT